MQASRKIVNFLRDSGKRISSLRGGTRSSKTYSTLVHFVVLLTEVQGKTLTVARQTMPALRASAMRDFFDILERLDLYDPAYHNKTANEYTLNGNRVEFVGLTEDRRVRGRKRDYLFLNEANECDQEAFRQLAFRTSEKIVLDYNPSEAFSWIYDDVETRDDCDLLVTNYQDNPFLEPAIVAEIERLKDADEEYWKIYGLGEIGGGSTRIFTHWRETSVIPFGKRKYGLDFGYNNPSALTEVTYYGGALYWREMLYQSKLTTADLIEKLKQFPELVHGEIIADSAEPKTIEEIRRAGFKIKAAYKDVEDTVKSIKAKPLFIEANSANLLREIKRYSWKTDKSGNLLDEVVKFDDHAIDAGRYASWEFHMPIVIPPRAPSFSYRGY